MVAGTSLSTSIQLFIYNYINSTQQKKHGIIKDADSADFDEEAVMWIKWGSQLSMMIQCGIIAVSIFFAYWITENLMRRNYNKEDHSVTESLLTTKVTGEHEQSPRENSV